MTEISIDEYKSEWLEDFNRETSYQYANAVAKRILSYQYFLYDKGEKNKKVLYEYGRRVLRCQYIKTVIRTYLHDIRKFLKIKQ